MLQQYGQKLAVALALRAHGTTRFLALRMRAHLRALIAESYRAARAETR